MAGGLGYVIQDDGEGTRLMSGASETPAPTVVTTGPDAGGSTAPTVAPPPATTQPAPTVTTTTTAPERLSASSRLSLDGLGPVDIGMTLDQASAPPAPRSVSVRGTPSAPGARTPTPPTCPK